MVNPLFRLGHFRVRYVKWPEGKRRKMLPFLRDGMSPFSVNCKQHQASRVVQEAHSWFHCWVPMISHSSLVIRPLSCVFFCTHFVHLGVSQNLLLSILMGWTSIYQLFWGSLGARVLTNSHFIHFLCFKTCILQGFSSLQLQRQSLSRPGTIIGIFLRALYNIPSGNLTKLWKITIFNGKIHYFYGHFQ